MSNNGHSGLVKLEKATQMLAEIKTVDDAKKLIDLSEAARVYAKQVELGLEAQNHAAEIKLRAQRRAGEILLKMKEKGERQSQGGDRKSKYQPDTLKLSDIEISKLDSSRWQQIAALPEKKFEEYIEESKDEEKELTTAGALKLCKVQHREERVQEIVKENKELDSSLGKFNVIYADPPWEYDFSASDNRKIENQYPTMPLEKICALPVGEIAAEDCVLFLWATSPKLREALQVIDDWGFEYKTSMVWVKDQIGMGYYARQKHEWLLIAARGNLPVPLPDNRPHSVIEAPRGKHSEKPEEFYSVIETMYPEYPKIELFSRKNRKGWASWGNQAK